MRRVPPKQLLWALALAVPSAAPAAAPPSILMMPVITFQHGVGGYAGAVDTELFEASPGTPQNMNPSISVDLDNSSGESQGLLRFDAIFGPGSDRIPHGSTINSASLTMNVLDPASAGDRVTLHRMLVAWPDTATWTSTVGGIQADGTEAVATADTVLADPASTGSHTFLGLETTLQAWSNGTANHGWVALSNSADGWDFSSADDSTATNRPLLTLDYAAPPLEIVKRAYQLNGTPILTGSTAPRGAQVRFLLYVNNARPAVTDVSLEDVLDAGFEYVAGTLRFDDSVAACADTICTGVEEAAIYSAAVAGAAGTDTVDGDEVSVSGSTISIGNSVVANAQLDIPADRVWGAVFTVRVR